MTRLIAAFRGETAVDLPEWFEESARLLAVIDATHWSMEDIDRAPAIELDRLLLVYQARAQAQRMSEREAVDFRAGLVRDGVLQLEGPSKEELIEQWFG